MRILICHGYLLKGTGSNQYVQSMARTMCRQGHHLAIMCQDADPRLDFVSAYLEERPDRPETGVAWPAVCSAGRRSPAIWSTRSSGLSGDGESSSMDAFKGEGKQLLMRCRCEESRAPHIAIEFKRKP